MPRRDDSSFTQTAAAIEVVVAMGRDLEPGEMMTYRDMAIRTGINLRKHPYVLTQSTRILNREGIYCSTVRGIGWERFRPLDHKHESSRQGKGLVRKARKVVTMLKATPILELPQNEQLSVSAHLGKWGMIEHLANEMSKEAPPRRAGNPKPDIGAGMAILLGYQPVQQEDAH